MNKREFPSRRRLSRVKDPKLIIIATEGKCTEKQYFEEVQIRKGKTNIHVHVLHTEDGASSPEYVLDRLDEFKKEYNIDLKSDQLWMVIDVDNWGEIKLSKIAQECQQKNYSLAVSNPCFEIWLLLHRCNLNDYSEIELQKLKGNEKSGKRTALERELVNIIGFYDKSNIDMNCFLNYIDHAIKEAEQLDTDPKERWPSNIGTRVYLLMKEML